MHLHHLFLLNKTRSKRDLTRILQELCNEEAQCIGLGYTCEFPEETSLSSLHN